MVVVAVAVGVLDITTWWFAADSFLLNGFMALKAYQFYSSTGSNKETAARQVSSFPLHRTKRMKHAPPPPHLSLMIDSILNPMKKSCFTYHNVELPINSWRGGGGVGHVYLHGNILCAD